MIEGSVKKAPNQTKKLASSEKGCSGRKNISKLVLGNGLLGEFLSFPNLNCLVIIVFDEKKIKRVLI
jgi:hypothetical protein